MSHDYVTVGPYETTNVLVNRCSNEYMYIQFSINISDAPFIGLADKLTGLGEKVPFYIEPYCKRKLCNRYTLEPNLTVRCANVVEGDHVLPTLEPLHKVLQQRSTLNMRLSYTFNNIEVKAMPTSTGPVSVVTYDSVDLTLEGPLFTSDYGITPN